METGIYVIAEHNELPFTGTLEAFTLARVLASARGWSVHLLVLGSDIGNQAKQLAEKTGCDVLAIEGNALEEYSAEGYCAALREQLSGMEAGLICIPGTSRGNEYAPALALALSSGCLPDVTRFRTEGEHLVFTRTGWYGKLEMEAVISSPRGVLTVSPGAFRFEEIPRPPGRITRVHSDLPLSDTLDVQAETSEETESGLLEAEVIVAGGRGLRKAENLPHLHDLASLFRRSAVGGSRPACDSGWLSYGSQIGFTGKTVAPRLYIACGISGSPQHIAGMKGARFVVVINSDPEAPFFQNADIGIVARLEEFIPVFVEGVRASRS